MSTPAFTVLRQTRTAIEADVLIAALRGAGLHPLDLRTSSHIGIAGAEVFFPIEVPTDEVSAAREFLRSSNDNLPDDA